MDRVVIDTRTSGQWWYERYRKHYGKAPSEEIWLNKLNGWKASVALWYAEGDARREQLENEVIEWLKCNRPNVLRGWLTTLRASD